MVVKRRLLGPGGWSQPVCRIDFRIGGAYRYGWRRDADGTTMGMGGVFREIVVPERIVSTETFDDAWYPGEMIGTIALAENAGVTTLTQTLLYESKDARDGVLKSPMQSGIDASYDRLEKHLASQTSA